MRRVLIIVVVLVLIALAVLWQAPATLVGHVLEDKSHGRVKLADTSGTVWSGQGVVVVGDARLPFAWRVHPTALARGETVVDLVPQPGTDTPRGTVTVREDGVSARNLRLSIPASLLPSAVSQQSRVTAGGTIDIASDALDLRRTAASGNVLAQWHDATVGPAGGQAVALGELTATLTAQQQRLVGPVRNTGGDVDVGGDVAIAPDGSAGALHLLVRPRPNSGNRADVIRNLGPEQGDGVRIDWQWGAR
jgi:hypothetical protein